jgi:predicted nucleic acid-binding Zn ribbon protein
MPNLFRRFAATGVVAAMSLLLSACLVSPGKFESRLDIRKDGRFSYGYTGEIHMLGLSKLSEMGRKSKGAETFEPQPCYKEDGEFEERPCTKEELANQKTDWEGMQQRSASKEKEDAEFAKMMLGGIDPASPKAAEELADRLRRQAGWKSVVYKGDGLFVVDFQISGKLDHDFGFPTIEKMPMANTFLALNRRADGSIRMDAPAFGPANGGGMGSFAQLAAMGAAMDKAKEGKDGEGSGDDGTPKFPVAEGRLVLTTDAQILANNTDEGPRADPAGQRLEWAVNPRNTAPPTALVKLGG